MVSKNTYISLIPLIIKLLVLNLRYLGGKMGENNKKNKYY
jgi:hypothetical protein